jgi:hypothetical protein
MIYIKEALPNPVGRDTDGEWIKLFNDSNGEIELTGWVLKDRGGKSFSLDGKTIKPSKELELKYSETRIPLNNDGDTIVLYDSTGKEVDKLEYQSISEEEIVIAPRFQAVIEQSIKSDNALSQVSSSEIINGSYEFWPLLIGVALAALAGFLGAAFYKKIQDGL